MAEKNLVEEALLQMENLQEAITNNAKGILASTMKEEISELVKESLNEKDEEVKESETEMTEQGEEEDVLDLDMDVEGEEEGEEEGLELDLDDELSDNEEDEELEMGDEEMLMTDLPGDDLEVDDEEEVLLPLDLTAASDDEILKVFKAMGEDDGIIVKQDGDDVHLADTETDSEYVIQLGESEDEEEVMETEDEMSESDEAYEEEEVVYEIEIGEEEEVSEEWKEEEMSEGDYGGNKDDVPADKRGDLKKDSAEAEGKADYEESNESASSRSLASRRNSPPKSSTEPTKKYGEERFRPGVRENELKSELKQLREKNEEYRKALNIFKEKLNEVAVFNSNLAYATRLFTEHSTTKQEKINILRRFDGVETLKESKSLYKTIKEDLGGKETNVVTESVQSKVTKTPTKGSANNLIESKTYENPQFLRMRDLMNKLK
jgi:hypothetical protein